MEGSLEPNLEAKLTELEKRAEDLSQQLSAPDVTSASRSRRRSRLDILGRRACNDTVRPGAIEQPGQEIACLTDLPESLLTERRRSTAAFGTDVRRVLTEFN